MFDKPRKSRVLLILQSLYPRMNLSIEEKQQLENLEKGHKGEMSFYQLLQETPLNNQLILFDLLLPSKQTEFQLDSLLIEQNKIFHFEIKNYEGDFYIQQDKWYVASSGKEVRNPLLQLKRSEFLLRQLLQDWQCPLAIESYIIFINPEFTLYQASLQHPIIFPTQLNRFLKKLQSSHTANTQKQKKLAQQFIENHIEQSSYEQIPKYEYEQLKKGLICSSCQTFLTVITFHTLLCKKCQRKINAETAVIQSVEEFHLLFPSKNITTKTIYEWCGKTLSMRTIRKILSKNFVFVSKGGSSYYLFKN